MSSRDQEFRELVSAQYGAATRRQARSVGMDRDALRRRLASGEYRLATARVIVATSAPDTFELRATVALLDAGPPAGITGSSGAALAGISGFELEPLQVCRPHTETADTIEGVSWHYTRYLPTEHLARLPNGLVVTVPARMLVDLAAQFADKPKRLERAFDSAMAARLVQRPQLERMAKQWCARGRRGSAFLREYLATRPTDWIAPASNLQRRFVELIKRAGLPEPRSEVNVGDASNWIGRVDCLDPELPLIAEVDSDRYHLAPLDQASDAERDAKAEAAGFKLVRFREHEVWYEPDVVIERWRTERNKLKRRRSAS